MMAPIENQNTTKSFVPSTASLSWKMPKSLNVTSREVTVMGLFVMWSIYGGNRGVASLRESRRKGSGSAPFSGEHIPSVEYYTIDLPYDIGTIPGGGP